MFKLDNMERRRKLILVVDDEPISFRLVEEFLKDAKVDCEIVTAKDGVKAYELAISLLPNLIITDWIMPEMDGIELTKKLKNNPETREIPVLMTTGLIVSEEELEEALTAGVFDCIRKPLSFTEVKARIKAALAFDQLLRGVREQQKERELISDGLEKLQAELELKHRELTLHAELLIHSRNSREKLMGSITKLQPFLSHEGKSKLIAMLRQFQWDFNDENILSVEKKFDGLNADLYNALEKNCTGITKNEKRLCAYLLMNHSASDIAKVTDKSLNSINVGFARIRSKLGLPNNKDLKALLSEIASV